jgi:hypothetical protein
MKLNGHRLTRRTWLTGLITGLLAVGGGSYHWRRIRQPNADDLAALIRRRLSYLNLDPAAAEQFAREYVRRFGALAMAHHHQATFGGLVSANGLGWVAPARARRLLTFERRTVSFFLRSTSYFREPAAAVRYVGFPDPYDGPCTNPFASFDLE